ncbi:MAG: hypothetical protein O7H40_00685, partial [Gammaproteobacteria bacterium]|nr:hypothetical protein [Gammaproteobacteria bacterium]
AGKQYRLDAEVGAKSHQLLDALQGVAITGFDGFADRGPAIGMARVSGQADDGYVPSRKNPGRLQPRQIIQWEDYGRCWSQS